MELLEKALSGAAAEVDLPECQLSRLQTMANQVIDDMEDKEVMPNRCLHDTPWSLISTSSYLNGTGVASVGLHSAYSDKVNGLKRTKMVVDGHTCIQAANKWDVLHYQLPSSSVKFQASLVDDFAWAGCRQLLGRLCIIREELSVVSASQDSDSSEFEEAKKTYQRLIPQDTAAFVKEILSVSSRDRRHGTPFHCLHFALSVCAILW